MGKKKQKIRILITSLCVIVSAVLLYSASFALYGNENDHDISKGDSYADKTGMFLKMDEEGNVSYVENNLEDYVESAQLPEKVKRNVNIEVQVENAQGEMIECTPYSSIQKAMQSTFSLASEAQDKQDVTLLVDQQVRATTKPSVVEFKVLSGGKTTPYKEVGTNISGYLAAGYAEDAAYLGTENGKVKFKMAGVTGYVNAEYVNIVPYTKNSRVSYYYRSKGNLYHMIYTPNNSSVQRVGPALSQMKENVHYYSYDGHYFYTSYEKMIADYQANRTSNAINASAAYYNYYQFISLRTKTSFSASVFDQRVDKGTTNKNSKLKKQGKEFINAQKYGVNALLSFGIAVNESGWGNSSIAQSKNNIFGLNAVDSNPGMAANEFPSVQACVLDFAKNWMSLGYLSPFDWRYYGPHLGDKQSGINVKYASDPYWGEKAAAQAYYLEDIAGKKETNKYKLVMETGNEPVKIMIQPSTKRGMLYRNGDANGNVIHQFPFVVLDTIKNSEGTWLKVKSDANLLPDRSYVNHDSNGIYHEDNDYGYVQQTATMKVITKGQDDSKPTPPPKPKPEPTVKPGDVNGDGKLSPTDYVRIKNHIMGVNKLKGNALKAADANKDGKISPADYVVVKNKIMGK